MWLDRYNLSSRQRHILESSPTLRNVFMVFDHAFTLTSILEIWSSQCYNSCHDTPLHHRQQLCEENRKRSDSVLWEKPLHLSIIQFQIQMWSGHQYLLWVHRDLDRDHMTLTQGHGTPLCHRQQLCKMLFTVTSNITAMCYAPNTDCGYRCALLPWHGTDDIESRS